VDPQNAPPASAGWPLSRRIGLLPAGALIGLAYDQSNWLIVWLIVGIDAVALIAPTSGLARYRPRGQG
jgi:hypothetical protein